MISLSSHQQANSRESFKNIAAYFEDYADLSRRVKRVVSAIGRESRLVPDRSQRRRGGRHLHDQPSPTDLPRYEVDVFVELISRVVYRVANDEPAAVDFGGTDDLVECVRK